jgi:hypothetical protein
MLFEKIEWLERERVHSYAQTLTPFHGICLSLLTRLNQHLVCHRLDRGGDAEQGGEGGVPGFAPIEAEGEFIEVGA